MKLQHIDLSLLKVSPLNVRKHGAAEGLNELKASIRSIGLIQPLLVRPNCEGFDVIAGQRRLRVLNELREELGAAEPVPCAILEDADDAVAIEASLAENLQRLPMDEIDQYEAFAALRRQNRTVAEIAGHFGVTELLVNRRLAIAALIPAVLAAYRAEKIEPATLQQLTMATPKQQQAWLKLHKSGNAPTGRRLKAWLFGAEIPVASALFPLEKYQGNIVSDLFNEQQFFDNAEKFWKLQTEAVIHRQAEYLAAGWSDVVILNIGETFSQWSMVKRGRTKGGKVYIACAGDGAVSFHEGWLDEKEAARRDRGKEKAKDATGGTDAENESAPATPELTQGAMRYIDLHRQNAVRMELLRSPMLALRLIVATILTREGQWDVRPEMQRPNGNKETAASLEASKARSAFDAERAAVGELLGLKLDEEFLLGAQESRDVGWGALFARLLAMNDAEVLRVLAFLMAESLPAGSKAVEALGLILDVDMDKWWTADEAFLALLRDKPAINAMLAEIAGKQTAFMHIKETAKLQKDAIRHCLAGTGGHRKAERWKPRYFRFPMQAYTKRKGLPAADMGSAMKKLFEKKH